MSLFAVFSPRTVEPKRPSRMTPTELSWLFSDCRRLITVFFFIHSILGAKIQRDTMLGNPNSYARASYTRIVTTPQSAYNMGQR